MIPATQLQRTARSFLTQDGFDRVTHLVMRDNEGIGEELARRIVEEAIKFVITAGQTSGAGLRPSKTVDIGWHALILHTEMYAALCAKTNRFVHHRPEGPQTLRRFASTLKATTAAIRQTGFDVDTYLWGPLADTGIHAGDCMHGECTEGGSGCAAPEPNPPS